MLSQLTIGETEGMYIIMPFCVQNQYFRQICILTDLFPIYGYKLGADSIITVSILCLEKCLQNSVYNDMFICFLLYYRGFCIIPTFLIVYYIVNLLLCRLSIVSLHRTFDENYLAGNLLQESYDLRVLCSCSGYICSIAISNLCRIMLIHQFFPS